MPQNVPPTLGIALQHKIEKSLGSQLNIQLQQQMGVFQASIMEQLQSLRDKIKSVKNHIPNMGWIRSLLRF